MRILQTRGHFSDHELKNILESQTQIRAYKDWQIIYLVQTNKGIKAEDLAEFLGIKKVRFIRSFRNTINMEIIGEHMIIGVAEENQDVCFLLKKKLLCSKN